MTNYAPCPQCGNTNAERVKFSWWGGLLGPKVLTHVKCPACGKTFNGKTGKDNTTGIVIYSIIVGLISLGLLVVVFALLGLVILSK